MKKAVVLILIALPIFLIVMIAFAGRIMANYTHIYVERVAVLNDDHIELADQELWTIQEGETKPLVVKLYPELATYKSLSYLSQDESICTVGEDGMVKGLSAGTTTIVVTALDNNKTKTVYVRVANDRVTSVALSETELTLSLDEMKTLIAYITPNTAADKSIYWQSSNNDIVNVSQNGKLIALSVGDAEIIVTTTDGEHTATCLVHVVDGMAKLHFTLIPNKGSFFETTQSSWNLKENISVDADVEIDAVQFVITSGSAHATMTPEGMLSIHNKGQIVTVKAYVGERESPMCEAELMFILR